MRLNWLFHGVSVSVTTECAELASRLNMDFEQFIVADATGAPGSDPSRSRADLVLRAKQENPPRDRIPRGLRSRRNRNCVSQSQGSRRWNTYEGGVLSEFDFASESGQIWSSDLHALHEITYLLILSRVGKRLDRRGLHRVHAMSIESKGRVMLGLMPMGGGKTSLCLCSLAADPGARLLSDDSPLVDRHGRLHPFPIRIGIRDGDPLFSDPLSGVDWGRRYPLKRRIWGLKWLLPVSGLGSGRVASGEFVGKGRTLLVAGLRKENARSEVRPGGRVRVAFELFRGMVIGVGLPVMREYFVEGSVRDLTALTGIVFSRARAALRLYVRSEIVTLTSGPDRQEAARVLVQEWAKKTR